MEPLWIAAIILFLWLFLKMQKVIIKLLLVVGVVVCAYMFLVERGLVPMLF